MKRASHLLFLNSVVFDAGECAADWIARIAQETGRQAAPLPLLVDDDGRARVDPPGARDGLFADCDTDVVSRATGSLRPEPGSIFAEAPAGAAWKDTPSTYLAGSDDKVMIPERWSPTSRGVALPR